MKRSPLVAAVLAVALASAADAQAPTQTADDSATETTPGVDAPVLTEPRGPPPAPPPTAASEATPPAFFERMLSVDQKGRVYEGRARTPVRARDVFERAGRVDLLEQSESLSRRRITLAVLAAVVGAAGVAVGATLIAIAPSPATPTCEADVRYYNDVCVPRYHAYQNTGSAVLVSGVIVASLLATLAWWSNPDVLSRDEMTKLVSTYNARLKKTLAPSGPSSLRLAPWVGPGGGGLAAMLRW
ncbi:MAG: hypothetical protein AB1730_04170 [Myxococcota bacterium]